METVANVKNYGAKGDGVTDDTLAIQRAMDDTSKTSLYFPRGRYKVTSSILVRKKLKIYGDGARGYSSDMSYHVGTVIDGQALGDNYIFKHVNPEEYMTVTYDGIYLMGKNLLDGRSENIHAITAIVRNCTFHCVKRDGIGIMLFNADFWKIEHNKFEGDFYCAIRVAGYIPSGDPQKNTTQVNISECCFIQDNHIDTACAISFELVNSCTVRNCDFAWTGRSVIDVGGKMYHTYLPKSTDMYERGKSNPAKPVGQCTDVTIDTCHFESMRYGVYVHGCEREMTHGITIQNSNFTGASSNTVCIFADKGVFGLNTLTNRMELLGMDWSKPVNGAVGIELGVWCHNSFLFMDNIVGKGTKAIKQNGGLNNVVFQRFGSGTGRNEISWTFPKIFAREMRYDNVVQGGSPVYE